MAHETTNQVQNYSANTKQIALLTLGAGILLGSTWSSRSSDLFDTGFSLSYTLLASIASLFLVAFVYAGRAPRTRSLYFLGAGFLIAHIAMVALTTLFGNPSEISALGLLSCLFEGSSLALGEALFFAEAVSMRPKPAAVAIAGAFLIANLYDCFFIGASSDVIVAQWLLGKVVAFGILAAFLRIASASAHRNRKQLETTKETTTLSDDWLFEDKSDTVPTLFNRVNQSTKSMPLSFVISVATFLLIQGFFATLSGLGGVGDHAFFDMSNGILMTGIRLLVFASCFAVGTALTSSAVVITCSLIWSAGLFLTVALWGSSTQIVGALTLETGLYTLQVFALVMASHFARNHLENAFSIMATFLAIAAFNQITRFLGHFFVAERVLDIQDIAICVAASFCVIVLTTLGWALLRRSSSTNLSGAPQAKSAVTRSDDVVPFAQDVLPLRESAFCTRFQKLCLEKELTEREQEVLFEALHGYTIEAVADKLCLSKETVKTYLSRIYGRVGVNNKQGILNLMDSYTLE